VDSEARAQTPQKARKAEFKKIRKVSFDADAGELYGVTILRRAATRRGEKEDMDGERRKGRESHVCCGIVRLELQRPDT
jgi:hypothetical protein